MEIIKTDLENPQEKVINKIAETLEAGKVVAMPFDTSYGLAADAANEKAIERLFLIKGRERKPVAIAVKDYPTIEDLCQVPSEQLRKFILKYLPGKVTFVLFANRSLRIAKKILGENGTLGIRIPNFKLTKEVAWEFARPFTATSANVSGGSPAFSAEQVKNAFGHREYQPDLLVDGGTLPESNMSTVVDATVWPPLILRQGEITVTEAE
jgi:L-threonylcarbamoyladenylate synthase